MARHLFRRSAFFAATASMIHRRDALRYVILAFLLLGMGSIGTASDQEKLAFTQCVAVGGRSSVALILDLTREVTANNATDVAFLLDEKNSAFITELDTLMHDCPDVDIAAARTFLKSIRRAKTSNRLIQQTGDQVKVYAFVVGRLANVTIHETRRGTTLHDDIGTLIDLLKLSRSAGGTAAAKATVWTADYSLKEPLALAEVSVIKFTDDPAGGEPTEGAAIKVAEIVTGSEEHFRLSANVPVNTVKMLDYDETKQEVVLKESPRQFMVGIDWYVGDVLDDPSWFDWRRLGVKGLVRFSKQPLDGLGLVAAYRTSYCSIFAGKMWNQQTMKVGVRADGTDKTEKRYQGAWQVGIGFDLTEAKKWLSGNDDNKTNGKK